MFIQSLILAVAKEKFTFQIESCGDDIIFTVMPSKSVPDCKGVIAQAHAALAVPLRVIVSNNDNADKTILTDIQSYMQQRKSLVSNLGIINKTIADATRALKQENKGKDTATSKPAEDTAEKTSDETAPSTKSRSLEL